MLLHSRTYGTQGAWIVIVHGLYGSGDNWASIARQLERNHRVLVPDLRNHGASPHSSVHTYETMAADLMETLQHHQIDEAHLIGHSMGGKVVMHLALKQPQKVKTLIVVDIAPKSYINTSRPAPQSAMHNTILQTLLHFPIHSCLSRQQIDEGLATSIPDDSLRQFLLKNVKRNQNHQFFWKINVEILWKYLPEIMDGFSGQSYNPFKGRSLFIKGELSGYMTDEDEFSTRKLFPQSDFVTIPKAGHWINAEQPELLIKTIQYFIE